MTASIHNFTDLTPVQAADEAVMGQILDCVEKIRSKGPIRRGELVCVAHGAAIKARLRGDAEAEQHFIQVAAELWAMKVDDILECAVSRQTVLHKMIEGQP